ncbi:MAG: molybdopterin-dependent oxidoreductase [archaeon]|jgi:DMSO/TMAO reductase YedYZ molybdopterin-dependent catalytic subunit
MAENKTVNWKIFLTVIVFVVLVSGCVNSNLVDSKTGTQLGSVEVKEYRGENLSSVNDFRENSINGPQFIDRNSYALQVKGLVESPKNYSYEEVLNNFQSYKKVVTLNCVEGWSVNILWEGVLLKDIFAQSKPLGAANTVIFKAYDGYTSSLPLDYIVDNNLLLAYNVNGVELPPERGFPFMVVAESKWGYKWVKWVTEIEFSNDPDYKGYWENYGYSNNGDLNKSFIGD